MAKGDRPRAYGCTCRCGCCCSLPFDMGAFRQGMAAEFEAQMPGVAAVVNPANSPERRHLRAIARSNQMSEDECEALIDQLLGPEGE